MQFEISRGLPLAQFVHRGAMGDTAGMARLAAGASVSYPPGTTYCFGFALRMASAMRGLLGRTTAERTGRASATVQVDASADPEDPRPGWVHALASMVSAARHPRAFYRDNLR